MRQVKHWAEGQVGLACRWQMIRDGVLAGTVDVWAEHLREVHPGVYLTGYAPITQIQRWWAATLTAPRTVLSHRSAGAYYGICRDDPEQVHVVRPGRRGTHRSPGLLVRYSATLNGNVGLIDGMNITMPERTVIDLWAMWRSPRAREKLLREALRLEVSTTERLVHAIGRHRGTRGIASLRATIALWTGLPFHRCRSDAEAYGLTVLQAAGIEIPSVNVDVAGFEADFVWWERRRLIEIDGPGFHKDKRLDAIKTAAWRAAGFEVERIPSTDVFDTPWKLVALAAP